MKKLLTNKVSEYKLTMLIVATNSAQPDIIEKGSGYYDAFDDGKSGRDRYHQKDHRQG